MRAKRITTLLLLLGCVAASGLEAQRTPERRAQREAARRGWIGISFHLLEGAGPAEGAAVVDRVYPESPADRAGVQAGDTIVRWNGNPDVETALEDRIVQPGDSVRLRVRRGGRDRDLVAVASEPPGRVALRLPGEFDELLLLGPDRLPPQMRLRMDSLRVHADSVHRHLRSLFRDSLAPRLRELPRGPGAVLLGPEGHVGPLSFDLELGLRGIAGAEFTEMNPELAGYFGTDRGVLVLRVVPETPASRAGLQAGDVVVAVEGRPVQSVRDLRRAIATARDREVGLEVLRKGKRQEVRMRWRG